MIFSYIHMILCSKLSFFNKEIKYEWMLVPNFEWSTPTLKALWLLWLSVIRYTVPSSNPSLQEYACDMGLDNNATFISNSIPVYLRVSTWPIDGQGQCIHNVWQELLCLPLVLRILRIIEVSPNCWPFFLSYRKIK